MTIPPLLKAMRPHQWIKNLLVVAGPLAGGVALRPAAGLAVVVAFACFCLSASGVYLINDTIDREADRHHPTKRYRPIAAGTVGIEVAVTVGLILLICGPLLALVTGHWQLSILMLVYDLIQLAYCIWLKHVTVIDLAVVSSGFLLRAMAGGVAASVPLSPLFLSVASFGSLFMVAGKRYSEVHLVGEGTASIRPSLEDYSASYLRFVWGMAGSATLTFYALWAFTTMRHTPLWGQISVAPFVTALLRYAVDIDKGAAGEPELIVRNDRTLQVIGLLWLTFFLISVVAR